MKKILIALVAVIVIAVISRFIIWIVHPDLPA